MMYLLTAFGLTPGGSSTVHIYTQRVRGTTQLTTRTTLQQNHTINNRTVQLTTRITQLTTEEHN